MKIGIIGCGKLGAPCANEMQRAGHDVVGYDTIKTSLPKFPLLNSIQDVVKNREIKVRY